MAAQKVSQQEWAELIAKRMSQYEEERGLDWDRQVRYLRRHITYPIIIGLAAIVIYWYFYGGSLLLKDILSWVIGITVVTTMLAIFGRISK